VTDFSVIKQMAAAVGLLESQVERIIQTAPLRYKIYSIPKRGGGLRVVGQPAREVKALQYWAIDFLRPMLPMHGAATAYNPGCSIIENAKVHSESNFILKLDFKEFFSSIVAPDVSRHILASIGANFRASDADSIARLFCWVQSRKPPMRLCIGAPSSPFISNSIMFEFDTLVFLWCDERGIRFTRYADDMTFSTRERGVLKFVNEFVVATLKRLAYPRLSLNEEKTVYVSRKNRMSVTGINITPDRVLSVGRGRKRNVRAMYHRWQLGLLTDDEVESLKGHLSFIESVEPGFGLRLITSFQSKK